MLSKPKIMKYVKLWLVIVLVAVTIPLTASADNRDCFPFAVEEAISRYVSICNDNAGSSDYSLKEVVNAEQGIIYSINANARTCGANLVLERSSVNGMISGISIDLYKSSEATNAEEQAFLVKCAMLLADDSLTLEEADEIGMSVMEDRLNIYVHNGYRFFSEKNSWQIEKLHDFDYPGVTVVARFNAEDVDEFSEGYAPVKIDGEWGFIDTQGNIVIEPQWSSVRFFREGLVQVSRNDAERYINTQGDTVVWPEWDGMDYCFSDGLLAVWQNKKWGYVDTNGEVVLSPKWKSVGKFVDGVAPVKFSNGKWGYIDKEGNTVIEPRFEYANDFDGEYACVSMYSEKGYIDRQGDFVIEPQFEYCDINPTENSLGAASRNKKWGFINAKGEYVIKPQYNYAFKFSHGLAWVKAGDVYGLINENNEFVIEPREDIFHANYHEGFCVIGDGASLGLIDVYGNTILPIGYSDITNVSDGLTLVRDWNEVTLLDVSNVSTYNARYTIDN